VYSAETVAPPPRTAPPGRPAARPARRRPAARVRDSLRRAAPTLLLYTAVRALGLACLAGYAWSSGRHPRTLLGLGWDAAWYHRIAEYGYGTVIPSDTRHAVLYNDLAFFPLYPMTVRLVSHALPVVGTVDAGLLVAWLATLSSAWAMYLIGERLHDRRTGVALVVLYGTLPHAVVQTMAYTEPVMTAFAAWSLYAALTRRWLWAGALAALAGCTRPNGIAVAAAVCAGVLADAWPRYRAGRRQDPRAWAGAALSVTGWSGYVLWVGLRTGDVKGYFTVQAMWGSRFDFGDSALHFLKRLAVRPNDAAFYVAALIVAACLLLFVLCVADRLPVTLLAYCAVLLLIGVGGAGFFQCKPRFLMPAFPLLLPAAVALARARPRRAACAVVPLAGFSLCYGTYLLTVSHIAL
jgi:Dolichyl-phosphate-mannose-protein mannosyltransferase